MKAMIIATIAATNLITTSLVQADEGTITNVKSLKKETLVEKEVNTIEKGFGRLGLLDLYRHNYLLPFYHTANPASPLYPDRTPLNQPLKKNEVKGQLSFLIPVLHPWQKRPHLLIALGYTQKMYWQVYTKSPYFRETNYQPELFVQDTFGNQNLIRLGINHQSNGRGGTFERSWNRAMVQLVWANHNYLVEMHLWSLIWEKYSSKLHNPNITHYLGHDSVSISHKIFKDLTATVLVSNLESGFKRGHTMFSLSYPLNKSLALYAQYFSGYGQSLMEYNHKTKAFGIGFSLSDWS